MLFLYQSLIKQVRTLPVRPDKVCGCRLNPSLISEVLSSLAARCISQSGSVLRRLYLRPQPHTTTIFPRDERLKAKGIARPPACGR